MSKWSTISRANERLPPQVYDTLDSHSHITLFAQLPSHLLVSMVQRVDFFVHSEMKNGNGSVMEHKVGLILLFSSLSAKMESLFPSETRLLKLTEESCGSHFQILVALRDLDVGSVCLSNLLSPFVHINSGCTLMCSLRISCAVYHSA